MARRPKTKTRKAGALGGLVLPAAGSAAVGAALVLAVAVLGGRFAGHAPASADTGLPAPANPDQPVLSVRIDPALWKTGVSWRRLIAHYGLERDVLAATLALHRLPDGACPSPDDAIPLDSEVEIALAPGKDTPCPVTDLPANTTTPQPSQTPTAAPKG